MFTLMLLHRIMFLEFTYIHHIVVHPIFGGEWIGSDSETKIEIYTTFYCAKLLLPHVLEQLHLIYNHAQLDLSNMVVQSMRKHPSKTWYW